MTDELVSFKVAKLAKELKYTNGSHETFLILSTGDIDERFYNVEEDREFENIDDYSEHTQNQYERPTQSLLQRWLREKHNVHISIQRISTTEGWYYCGEYGVTDHNIGTGVYSTYEKTLEVALYEALKLLKI